MISVMGLILNKTNVFKAYLVIFINGFSCIYGWAKLMGHINKALCLAGLLDFAAKNIFFLSSNEFKKKAFV